jgi:thiamine kinase-like enzyme
MAGDGIRFGGVFKPLHTIGESYFIELVKYRFDILRSQFNLKFFLIFRQDQEEKYNVISTFTRLFINDTFEFCILNEKTEGPFQTVVRAIQLYSIKGPSFICDCDLSIDVSPFIPYILESRYTALIPIWSIKESMWHEWGKVVLNETNSIVEFCEKDSPSNEGSVFGIIGCHYLNEISDLVTYFRPDYKHLSTFFQILLKQKKPIKCVEIQTAYFFGTPDQLILYKLMQAKQNTYFIDFDGTLVFTTDPLSYDINKVKIIPNSLSSLQKLKQENAIIVITTARKNKEQMIELLSHLQIPYDHLVTNISSGQRILINDKKPYFPLMCTASAYQPDRDSGIGFINVPKIPTILKQLHGSSGASVYLIEQNNTVFVRKYIKKTTNTWIHYENLRRQVEDLCRFNFYWKGCCPKILSVCENNEEFYFDMEYLQDYVQVSVLEPTEQIDIVTKLFSNLFKEVYCFSKQINGSIWISNYIKTKIITKLDEIQEFDELFNTIVNSISFTINSKSVKGLRNMLESINLEEYTPSTIQCIHGDLTLENILIQTSTADIKFIDNGGSSYMDSYYLDLGKVFQSIIAKYERWTSQEHLFECLDKDTYKLNSFNLEINFTTVLPILLEFSKHLDKPVEAIFDKGFFYMSTHLIRAIPYLYKKNKDLALYAALLSVYYLSH